MYMVQESGILKFLECLPPFSCSFPARAVAMIKEGRLRQMLLQSIAADKSYWESQGGRSAIEDILDVLDRRGRIFLRHISS